MMTRLTVLALGAVMLAGCTTVPVFSETGSPTDLRWWRTESRTRWYWYGLPVGQSPSAVYFSTQETCETFRRAHPAYTKPEEVCQPVYGVLTRMPVSKRRAWDDRDTELDSCGADDACRRAQLCQRYKAAGRADLCPTTPAGPSAAPSADCTPTEYWSPSAGGCVPR